MKRAVIVGCGNIAAVHAAVLTAQKDTELVGVADIHFEKAQDYAERFHTKPYASLEEMIEKEQPDVLHVCTPHYLHVPMTQYALERGINVFMEKPPAITLAQLDQLKQAVYASKAKLGLCKRAGLKCIFYRRSATSLRSLSVLSHPRQGSVIDLP